ncbi:MAG TPA: beta-galactosidase, partial [Candidatus Brocadiia bacterium]|nr:beta-galactosidase [Candidatus Brocadiia bacterium]
IVVDLGKVCPISGIMINCPGGGVAGVQFPKRITFRVSDDNESFYEVAELTPKGLKQDGKSWYTHKFLADGLKTRGRYVMISLDKAGTTAFADEVEVYKGDLDPASVTFAGKALNRMEMAFAQYALTPRTYTRGASPETPHIKWMTPLSGGPVKAIVMAYSDDMRDVVEVAQRLDLDYTPVSHYSFYRPEPLGQLMQEQIERALPTAQVMIVGGFRWEAMPKDLVEKIKARVKEGMGLVCVSLLSEWLDPVKDMVKEGALSGDQGILDPVPVSLLPGYVKRKSYFQLADFGKGRVAFFQPQLLARSAHSLTMDFSLADIGESPAGPIEYSYGVLNRLILWAARRDVRKISQFSASPEAIRVEVAPRDHDGRLEVVVRDTFFEPMLTKQIPAPAAGGKFEIRPPAGGNGTHAVDVWLRDAKGAVVDLASSFYETRHPAKIEAIALSKPVYAAGEPIEASVKVGGAAAGMRVEARLLDTLDREVAPVMTAAIGADGKAVFRLPLPAPLTLAARLHVSLLRGDTLIEKRFERVWIDLPTRDDYTFCAWYAWTSQPHAYYGMKLLRQFGVDTLVTLPGVERAQNTAWGNVRHGPENVSRVVPANKDDSRVRVPCLTDPDFRAKVGAKVAELAKAMRPYGVTEWSLGDESTLGRRDYCTSPSCLAAFREYLKQQHKTLAALNESWGSRFAKWEDVTPAKLTDVEKGGKIGAWLEHRRYMESVFADYHDWLRKVIVKEIPEARVGISGTPNVNSYSGHDWWKLMQGPLTHLSGYGGMQRELQRSFVRPGTFVTTFLGYDYKDSDEQRGRYAPWDLLFHGSGGVNYYTLESNTLNCPLIRPDMSLTNKAGWFFEEIRELKAGFGKLFMEARLEQDGIAVHYSPASIHAATALGLFSHRERLKNFGVNLNNVGKILQQIHAQYDFVHEEQMARGELRGRKALILPWSSAISEREAAAIKEFVEQGGTVIADSFCGVRDDHGSPRAMLDDLFGVKQPADVPQLEAKELVMGSGAAAAGLGALAGVKTVPVACGAERLALAGGAALAAIGKAPAVVVNKVGKGRAILLNCSFFYYGDVAEGGVAGEVLEETAAALSVTAPIRAFVRGLLDAAGATAPIGVVTTPKEMSAEIELARWKLGEARLLGVVRSVQAGPVDRKDTLSCALVLPKPFEVYESRSGKYLGKTAKIEDRFARGLARVYALLPYRVEKVTLSGGASATAGQAVKVNIGLATSGGPAGTHVAHLSVSGPDGKERPWYAQNVVVKEGRAEAVIPLAFNDPAGEWKVVVRDVATGVEGAMSFRAGAQ